MYEINNKTRTNILKNLKDIELEHLIGYRYQTVIDEDTLLYTILTDEISMRRGRWSNILSGVSVIIAGILGLIGFKSNKN